MRKDILLKTAAAIAVGSVCCAMGAETKTKASTMKPKGKQTDRPAIVFLVAGQSNAGGCGVFSLEVHKALGRHKSRPLVAGSTAEEVGLSTDAADYTHSYMWVPGEGFQRANPETNVRPTKMNEKWHGMELPVIRELEKRFPDNDIFVVKYGPGNVNLHHQWNPTRKDGLYAMFLGYYRKAMATLSETYPEIRVVGLYWDQGETDGINGKHGEYAKNLKAFIAAIRRDTHVPELNVFVRKHIFNWPNIDAIIAAQEKVAADDLGCYLLDIDLGDRGKNYKAWAYSHGNGHVSSKGFVALTKKLFDGPLRDATVESFGKVDPDNAVDESWGPFVGPWKRHEKNPIIKLEGKETYSIQNGPQTVIRWKDKWHMFLQTSQPMVTKLAVSDDGLTWKRPHHDYLLKPTMGWEGSYNLAKAAVVRDDEVWLYYFGKKGKTEMIALARSKDLVSWTKEPKPILTHGDSRIEGERAFPDCVIKEGDTWYMYYDVGFDYHHNPPDALTVGVATSRDGINWTDSPKSPVLTTSKRTADSWEDGMVSQCSVTKIGGWFYMLYSGSTNNHGRKHSGKNRMAFGLARAKHPEGPWEKYPHNPVFTPTGNEEDFDGVFLQHPCPVRVGNQWRLYYNGWTTVPKSKARPVGAEYAIGVAFVDD